MGDILLATPLIRWMRRRFPEAEIDFVLRERFRGVLEGNPHLDRIISPAEPLDKKFLHRFVKEQVNPAGYDLAVDIHSSLRSRYLSALSGVQTLRWKPPRCKRWLLVKTKLNLLKDAPPIPLRYLEAVKSLGVEDDGGGLEFFTSNEAGEKRDTIWRDNGLQGNKVAAIAPGAVWKNKQWGKSKFAALGRKLLESGAADALVFLGSANETDLCREIADRVGKKVVNLAGSTDIALAGAILQSCALFIGNDSGLAHLAAAVGTPSVVIFGPTVREFGFFPFRSRSEVVEKELPCRPCSHLGGKECPKKHFKCMEDIKVDDVLRAVLKVKET